MKQTGATLDSNGQAAPGHRLARRSKLLVAVGLLIGLVIAAVSFRQFAEPAHGRWNMTKAGRWISRTAAAIGLAAPMAAADAAPVPPTAIGINLSSPNWYRRSRAFANLMIGAQWGSQSPDHKILGPDDIDGDGNPRRLPGDAALGRMLTLPNGKSATIRCTFQGKGTLKPTLTPVSNVRQGNNMVTFDWKDVDERRNHIILKLVAMDPVDPVRNIDCRETSMSPTARFDPAFIEWLHGFKVVRFMDWQRTNTNEPVTWATRTTPRSIDILARDGASIEDMVALATAAGADPWFNMPWNADDDYIARFAKLVHDTLPRDRTVYVECGNEVWNFRNRMTKQALREGQAAGLSADGIQALLRRYAQRLTQVMDIWAREFADRPGKLVRVAAVQNGPRSAEIVLSFGDTAKHVDMLATAPYFGYDFGKIPPADVDAAYARMDAAVEVPLRKALTAREVAFKYHKRYGAYEGGQHIVLKDLELEERIQRDPRMYDAYRKYLALWRAEIGDTLVLYNSVQSIGKSGGWGLAEYVGQPLSEAPKLRAVREQLPR
ncbi:MAG TPA: hypothetical protein VNT42_04905 [Sphingomonas sp.]|nr:hypothetical protein [Sphingomonas sp.]